MHKRYSSKLKMWMVYLPKQLASYKKSLKKLIKSVTASFITGTMHAN